MYRLIILFVGFLSPVFLLSQDIESKAKDLLEKGSSFQEQGEAEQAVKFFNQILNLENDLIDINSQLLVDAAMKKTKALQSVGDFQRSNAAARESLQMIKRSFQDSSILRLFFFNQLGTNHIDLGATDSADFYSNKAFELSKEDIGVKGNMDHLLMRGNAISFKAELAYFQGDYQGSVDFLNQQLDLNEKEVGENHPVSKRTYMQLGIGYSGLGLLDEALKAYDRAKIIEESQGEDADPAFLGTVLINMSSLQAYMYDKEGSLQTLLRANDLYLKVPTLRNEMADLYSSTANLYSEIGIPDSVKYYLEKVAYYNSKHPTSLYNQSAIASKVASANLNIGNYDEALAFSSDGLRMKKQLYGEAAPVIVYDYVRFGKIYSKKGELDLVSTYLDSAVYANTNELGDSFDPYLDMTINTEKMKLMKARYDASQDPQLLSQLFDFIDEQNKSIYDFRKNLTGELSRTTRASNFYSEAVIICYDIFQNTSDSRWAETAFVMSELNKSLLLYDFVSQSEKLNAAGLSESTINQKDVLRKNASELESRIAQLKSSGDNNSTKILELSDSLDLVQDAYQRLLANIKESNPAFYQFKYADQQFSLENLQSLLANDMRQMLTYHIGEKSIVAFAISGEEVNMSKTDWGKLNEESILRLRQLIISNGDQQQINTLLTELYQTLIQPNVDFVRNSKLTIIPDGVLSYLPFDLLKEKEDGSSMINNYTISYDYSAFLYQHFKNQEATNKSKLLALAPKFNNPGLATDNIRSEIVALPGAEMEVDQIGEIFSSTILKGNQATESAFKSEATNYGILHFATHALVDDFSPGNTRLIFDLNETGEDDGYLHSHEIYNMKLNADLVTLSACNTGFGKIKKGEGVMSLSRAFAYAGSPNSLVSLWPASDKSSPIVMESFYQNLADGMPKDEALRKAKLDYLESTPEKGTHPFYWSGFVFIGNPQPIDTSSNIWLWILISTVLLVLVFVLTKRGG